MCEVFAEISWSRLALKFGGGHEAFDSYLLNELQFLAVINKYLFIPLMQLDIIHILQALIIGSF